MVPILVVAAVGAVADDAPPRDTLLETVESYYDEFLLLNPILATYNGDHRYDDRFTDNIGPEYRRRSLDLERNYLAKIEKIPPGDLEPEDRLTWEVFRRGRREAIAAHAFPDHLLPVNQIASVPVILAMMGSGGSFQPFDTVEDYERWLRRVDGWGPWVDQAIRNMREGMEAGVILPRVIVTRVLPLLEVHIVEDLETSTFYGPILKLSDDFGAEDRKRLTKEYRAAIREKIVPPYQRLHEFLEDVYLPRARDTVGLSALPGGEEWYEHLVRLQTTTDLSPAEIHRIGLAEVQRISAEIDRASKRKDLGGTRGAPSFASAEDMLDGYRALRARVEPALPRLFERLPAADFEIRSVARFAERSAPGASYLAGSPDGSRPGVFYVNTRGWRGMSRVSEALFLHEAIPGHHFQISLQRELADLPRFRRFGHQTAYVEGWALYVEGLGTELGLYTTRTQLVAALRSELFRARRLVVDTGLHAMGWSRQRAIDYIGSSVEVDRYMVLPGQALAYKIGQLEIAELRERARAALGERFDLRAFHRVVLEDGALPLDILEAKVDGWILVRLRGDAER